VYLHGAGPLRRLSRLLAGVLTFGGSAITAGALPSDAASGSLHHLEGPAGVSASAFGADFAVMARFGPLARAGRGKLAVLLPRSDVPGSDVPETTATAGGDSADLERALRRAGLPPTQYVVQSANGDDATQYSDAVKDVSDGARVIVLDPINSGVGAQIEAFAKSHGAEVVDYDGLTLAGSRAYEVGFDTVEAGRLMGHGLVRCAAAWHDSKPHVVVLRGDNSDTAATLLAQGYEKVLHPLFRTGRWVMVGPALGAGGPGVDDLATQFRSILSAHHDVNAALFQDGPTEPIVTYLKSQHIRPRSFPTAGQGATVPELDEILSGYVCGTVYEPVVIEAQAAVALALYLRAGVTPPRSLVNGTTDDTTAQVRVPSVVLAPVWVTANNIKSTVVRDGTVRVSQLCAKHSAAACVSAGPSR
jgi:D-xylose transport system substrate-binding protein